MNATPDRDPTFDVVIIGGALSGAATALLLLRERPSLRVLIVERSTAFSRRVGEATVEVSGYFLMRRLGLTQYLDHQHLNKNGLRFWFFNHTADRLDQCSEIGGKYLSRVPSYLVDRAALDEEVLRRAVAAGAELWRPAVVQDVALNAGSTQRICVKRGDETVTLAARWVVDASGVAAILSRAHGWWRPNREHPTTAAWSRWRNVRDFDDLALAEKFPCWSRKCFGVRGTATNHLMGDGWWAWWIPLRGGDVSIGVTFDQRLVDFPQDGPVADRLKQFLMRHPVARELMADATWVEGDVHWRKNLPYYSTVYAGDGFALVGDAGAFIDPFYSPGMDWITYSASRATALILAERDGKPVAPLVEKHNRDFSRSYDRWFRALYQDKYEYFGDFELMKWVFLLDLGFYYFGVVAQPYFRGANALLEPSFSTDRATPFYHWMRCYHRRFVAMARSRRERGLLGRRNARHRFMFGGYTFAPISARHVVWAMLGWLRLELTEGWRTWFARSHVNRPGVSAETGDVPQSVQRRESCEAVAAGK